MKGSSSHPLPLLILAGPTACGKTAVAVELAAQLGGEIVSVDSMQVYKGMDIGTAKPSPEELARVQHHLLDVAEVTHPFDVAQFTDLANDAVAAIRGRGHVPILCGGTGLYFKAFLEGLGESPASDPAVRAELETMPLPDLQRELARLDPETYATIDTRNPRRLIRALEVVRLTGKPFHQQKAHWAPAEQAAPGCFGLLRTRDDLYQRIDERIDRMFERGLIQETQALVSRGLKTNRCAAQALGYRQVLDYLEGNWPLSETIAMVKARTHNFAKRQMTWFRRQMRLQWIHVPEGQAASDTAATLLASLSHSDGRAPAAEGNSISAAGT